MASYPLVSNCLYLQYKFTALPCVHELRVSLSFELSYKVYLRHADRFLQVDSSGDILVTHLEGHTRVVGQVRHITRPC